MITEELNPTGLFYKGKLFQIGDIISCKVEFLNTSGCGFEHYNTGGFLTKIIVKTGVFNSMYLNNGFTYSSIGGLGYLFEIDYKDKQYAFESDLNSFPTRVSNADRYLHDYYSHPINKDKLEHLQSYLNMRKTSNMGHYLRKNHKEIYNYICFTFRIRFGEFGLFTNSNDLSSITFEVLRKCTGFNNTTNNEIYKFINSAKGGFKSLN